MKKEYTLSYFMTLNYYLKTISIGGTYPTIYRNTCQDPWSPRVITDLPVFLSREFFYHWHAQNNQLPSIPGYHLGCCHRSIGYTVDFIHSLFLQKVRESKKWGGVRPLDRSCMWKHFASYNTQCKHTWEWEREALERGGPWGLNYRQSVLLPCGRCCCFSPSCQSPPLPALEVKKSHSLAGNMAAMEGSPHFLGPLHLGVATRLITSQRWRDVCQL